MLEEIGGGGRVERLWRREEGEVVELLMGGLME